MKRNNITTLAKNLAYCRKRFRVTQVELALLVKKTQTTVGGWEKSIAEPNLATLSVLSNFFGISLDYLVKADLEVEKLVTDEHVEAFKITGKPLTPFIGDSAVPYQRPEERPESLVREAESDRDWLLARMVRENSEKLDEVIGILRRYDKRNSKS